MRRPRTRSGPRSRRSRTTTTRSPRRPGRRRGGRGRGPTKTTSSTSSAPVMSHCALAVTVTPAMTSPTMTRNHTAPTVVASAVLSARSSLNSERVNCSRGQRAGDHEDRRRDDQRPPAEEAEGRVQRPADPGVAGPGVHVGAAQVVERPGDPEHRDGAVEQCRGTGQADDADQHRGRGGDRVGRGVAGDRHDDRVEPAECALTQTALASWTFTSPVRGLRCSRLGRTARTGSRRVGGTDSWVHVLRHSPADGT